MVPLLVGYSNTSINGISGIEKGTLAIFFVKSGTYNDNNIVPVVTTGYGGTITNSSANTTTGNSRIIGPQHHTNSSNGW